MLSPAQNTLWFTKNKQTKNVFSLKTAVKFHLVLFGLFCTVSNDYLS